MAYPIHLQKIHSHRALPKQFFRDLGISFQTPLHLNIHRGNKEVGASCIEIRSGSGASIFIDAGLELYGEKAKLPKEIENTDAIFLSHAHPDHFGLLGRVPQNIPMYCGEITENILQIMIAFNGDKFDKINRKFLHFKSGEEVKIKDISITPFLTDHRSFLW